MPKYVDSRLFDRFFKSILGLPWEAGDFRNGVFEAHRDNSNISARTLLQSGTESYTMTALMVKSASSSEKIFVPADVVPISQPHVSLPQARVQASIVQDQAAIVMARVERGFVCYIGDIDAKKETNDIILAMCRWQG